MFEYRQVLARLRQGDTEREIARAGLMGRPKVRSYAHSPNARAGLSPRQRFPRTRRSRGRWARRGMWKRSIGRRPRA